MANRSMDEQPHSARSEILVVERIRSSPVRSASQRIHRPSAPICCAYCKLPLLIEVNSREVLTKSRPSSTIQNGRLCQECTEEKSKNARCPTGRLVKSASMNWSDVGDNIETWFEKARTPDQRVVYNFLHQINNKQDEIKTEKSPVKDLDDILSNLKKYQTRFHSARPRTKFTRGFESSSWRVMRQPMRANHVANELENNEYNGSIFTTTERKIGSTFLIHPNWI